MQYFDVEAKSWKPLASTIPPIEATQCYCAASAGNKLYVAVTEGSVRYIYCYDAEGNVWEKQPHPCNTISNLCIIEDHVYAVSPYYGNVPQRYNFATRQWQSFAKVSTTLPGCLHHNGATVLSAKVYVLYWSESNYNAELSCFDPVKNKWELKAKPCQPHFGSSLIEVNNRLYVVGGNISYNRGPCGNPAKVELYDEVNNTWSVVEQNHIPPNNLGAVELEGKVYFIINKFPVDSGIRIPPGELYPVPLGEWKNLGKIDQNAVLSYLPVKRESLKTE